MICEISGKGSTIIDANRSQEFLIEPRIVLLHTLHHGSVEIQVRYFKCEYGNIMLYDQVSDGMYCATQRDVFGSDLLDGWVFDVCGAGMSFRDSSSSLKRKSWVILLNRIGALSSICKM